jgi:hypothetical protein
MQQSKLEINIQLGVFIQSTHRRAGRFALQKKKKDFAIHNDSDNERFIGMFKQNKTRKENRPLFSRQNIYKIMIIIILVIMTIVWKFLYFLRNKTHIVRHRKPKSRYL